MRKKIANELKNTPPRYRFRLFIAGDGPKSQRARETLNHICKTHLKGNYTLEVIDVLEDYKAALDNNILLAPTLIIESHQLQSRIIGSLDDAQKVLEILGLSGFE